MILDLINAHRATVNKDPEYNVQVRSAYPIRHVPYKPDCGEDSFEIYHRNMQVTVNFMNDVTQNIICDRVIEEFDKLVLIKNFKQKSFDLKDIRSIVVE